MKISPPISFLILLAPCFSQARLIGREPINPHEVRLGTRRDPTFGSLQYRNARKSAINATVKVERETQSTNPDVIVVGAGAAGLGAAYRLREEYQITNVLILEADSELGGRMKRDLQWQPDYPIDLGASYVPNFFRNEMEQIADRNIRTRRVPQNGGRVFVDYTYNSFFRDYVAPNLNIVYDCVVNSVDYTTSDNVQVSCADGSTYQAPVAVVTVSLAVLKSSQAGGTETGDIEFSPSLPESLVDHRPWWPGFKIFIEFRENFYVDQFCVNSCYDSGGEELFWDYTAKSINFPNQQPNVMAGYMFGTKLETPTPIDFTSNATIYESVMERLATVWGSDPQDFATGRYLVQNWNDNPYIRGTMAGELEDEDRNRGAQNLGNKVFIAGEAYAPEGDSWGWVYSAFYSGFDAADQIARLIPTVPGGTVIVREVETSSDDAEEYLNNGRVVLDSTDLELVRDWNTDQLVGIRFTNIDIAQGATIVSAQVQFVVDQLDDEGEANIIIHGQATDNAETFSTSSDNISNRETTQMRVEWNNIPLFEERGDPVPTPDLKSIVQELVDRPGWSPGNAIAFIFSGSGERTVESFDGTHAPMIRIEYTSSSASPTASPITVNPTMSPTGPPTLSPSTGDPTISPTDPPTLFPSTVPTRAPSASPTPAPPCGNTCYGPSNSCGVGCSTCSPCEALVCADDPYCCTDSWDRKCGDKAANLCSNV